MLRRVSLAVLNRLYPSSRHVSLLCHWRGDDDLARAFLDHYSPMVDRFVLILHGSAEENGAIRALCSSYPIEIAEVYDGDFDEAEKVRRLNGLLRRFHGQWVFLVDSDELVELPFPSIGETIQALSYAGQTCLAAPMLQRLRRDASLNSPETIADPFAEFPLCSPHLYELMGSNGLIGKFPLFRCSARTVVGGGNHEPPNGAQRLSDNLRGVTHHYKWKRSAVDRIRYAVSVGVSWAPAESIPYLNYLEQNNSRLPTAGAFEYSRAELFRRGLLRAG